MSSRGDASKRAKRTCQGCHQRRPEKQVMFVSVRLPEGRPPSVEETYKWYGLWLCARCRQMDFDDLIRRRMQFNEARRFDRL
jgi:hypothetical protein